MGNSKSKKVKISQEEPAKGTEETKGRINYIKSEIPDAPITKQHVEVAESDLKDNASSASTVEVLDDK